MIILTIRTDKPAAEIGLFDGQKELSYETWEAHRQLAATLHLKINDLLTIQGLTFQNINGIAVFKGPGSFTGLRIGLATANALAYSLEIPIVSQPGYDWQKQGIKRMQKGETEIIAMPEYGSPVHITKPRR